MARPAVFLDRDGVVIEDVHLLSRAEQVSLCPGVPESILHLKRAGLAVVVVSNQTVIPRGLASVDEVVAINERIQDLLYEAAGVRIDRFYLCPHHPKATIEEWRVDCECRKPRPGMLLQAARELDLDLVASYMIGDRVSDILAGYRAGCRTILVETGMHNAPLIDSVEVGEQVEPDLVSANVARAVEWILENQP